VAPSSKGVEADPGSLVWNGVWRGLRPAFATIVRFRIGERFGQPWPDCIWSSDVLGDPVLEFDEDLDGDGVRDILLKGTMDVYSHILSGASGAILATFAGGEVVVADRRGEAERGPLVAVWRVPDVDTGDNYAILTYDSERQGMKVLNSRADGRGLNADDAAAVGNVTKSPIERTLAECERNGGLVDASRVYELGATSAPDWRPSARVILPSASNFQRLVDTIGYDPAWYIDLAHREKWLDIVFSFDPRPQSE
jgi:hypothetical protein